MKYKKGIIASACALIVGGTMMASANMGDMMGHYAKMDPTSLSTKFQADANLIGVSVDEVKNAWADGKSLFDLAKEKGISTTTLKVKMDSERDLEMKNKMDALVAAGTITRAQADKKLATMKTQMQNGNKIGKTHKMHKNRLGEKRY